MIIFGPFEAGSKYQIHTSKMMVATTAMIKDVRAGNILFNQNPPQDNQQAYQYNQDFFHLSY